LLYEVALENSEVDQSRKTEVFFQDFGDSALVFDMKFYSNNLSSLMKVRSDLRFAIDEKFRENKVVIAFPQRDIHIKSMVSMKNAAE
jgi:small-conductance mechanosensitive channel